MVNMSPVKLNELLTLARQNAYIDSFEVRENELWIQIGSVQHVVSHDKIWMFMVGLLRESSLQSRLSPGRAA